jgi:hypothetical protein
MAAPGVASESVTAVSSVTSYDPGGGLNTGVAT